MASSQDIKERKQRSQEHMSLISSWPGKLKIYLATQHPLDRVSVTFIIPGVYM